jgi:anti-sigma factor (TIGR02949 family)
MTSDESQPADSGNLLAQAECRESLTELYWFLDGELTVERRSLIRTHLEACSGCLETYDFEAELRLAVSTSCRERHLPPGLQERIARVLTELTEER